MASSNPQTYMTQWLATATKGNVVPEFSLLNNRMRLRCLNCGMCHTSPAPEGTTVDHSIQEFVRLHAHNAGTWTCYNCAKQLTCSLTEHAVECPGVKSLPKPVTADFKPIPSGKIDLSPEKEAQIKTAVDNIKKEYAEKLDDNKIAAKIKAIQAETLADAQKTNDCIHDKSVQHTMPNGDVVTRCMRCDRQWLPGEEKPNTPAFLAGMTASKTGWHAVMGGIPVKPGGQSQLFVYHGDEETATDFQLQQAEKALAAKKAVENALKIKVLQQQLDDLNKKLPAVHFKPPDPEPAGPDSVMVTGRKFR